MLECVLDLAEVALDLSYVATEGVEAIEDGLLERGASGIAAGSALGLAPDDLRDALMAHAHDLGDGLHRQPIAVGGADGRVAGLAQVVAGLVQGCFTADVVLGKGRKTASGLGGLAFWTGDPKIV